MWRRVVFSPLNVERTLIKPVKITIAAVCLIAAIVVYWMGREEPEILDTPDTETAWKCANCGAFYSLGAAKVDAMEKEAGGLPLICEGCRKKQLYRVAQCMQCQGYYFSSDVPGSTGRCPVCFPPDPGEFSDGGAEEESGAKEVIVPSL
ncbi:MAG TPA: hypothetical protein P5081_18560 [Phycisphaerae bacterium]|nr:hypothetical protein [Phycisphaerae bacterium]